MAKEKKNDMQKEWFEELPKECPPVDSQECNGIFYRVACGNPATSADFFSQRKLAPTKPFAGMGVDECVVRAVSVFAELDDAKSLLKLPKFRKAQIAMVNLLPDDGNIKKTFKKSHYSWWRSRLFDVRTAKIIA